MTQHISRWDLDKTYLRTEFDTVRDLVRTAFERADEKRTNPGAATLLREMARAGVSIHILSGSPEQMRRRLEDKLRLDGIVWDSFILKPNLQNVLRLRFRAVKDQLGYKLPALLEARTRLGETAARETLFGDDAEADAFVYSLYADIMAGRAGEELVHAIAERGRVYEDVAEEIVRCVRLVKGTAAVERILIHLEQQTPPGDFAIYGTRVVPFYNYLQAAFVVHEDERLSPQGVLRVASELVTQHRFDGDALARSYHDLGKRGHLRGTKVDELTAALDALEKDPTVAAVPGRDELRAMVERLPKYAEQASTRFMPPSESAMPDYLALVNAHNPRRKKKR
jgi:phosphoglycolate phosphatase-like HAD superfamily hydrolase